MSNNQSSDKKGGKYCCVECVSKAENLLESVCMVEGGIKKKLIVRVSNWFYLFLYHSVLFLLVSWSGLTKIPEGTAHAANWTASLRTQFHTWNGNISQQSETDVKGFWCSYDNSRGSNKREITSTWSMVCRPREARQDFSTLPSF